jgi:hypothetical protein
MNIRLVLQRSEESSLEKEPVILPCGENAGIFRCPWLSQPRLIIAEKAHLVRVRRYL